ncbi:THO complex subunit 4A [Tanacetum coccineum]
MAGASLDMSLDDLVKKIKDLAAMMPETVVAVATDLVPNLLVALIIVVLLEGGWDGKTRTKIYISNVDYGVSNEDIKELFAEVGNLKKYSIHYVRK